MGCCNERPFNNEVRAGGGAGVCLAFIAASSCGGWGAACCELGLEGVEQGGGVVRSTGASATSICSNLCTPHTRTQATCVWLNAAFMHEMEASTKQAAITATNQTLSVSLGVQVRAAALGCGSTAASLQPHLFPSFSSLHPKYPAGPWHSASGAPDATPGFLGCTKGL